MNKLWNHDISASVAAETAFSSKRGPRCWRRGQLVRSLAGRDKGQYYIVLDQEADGFLLVADGRKRPADRPKRKNGLHLQGTYRVAADLEARMQTHPLTNEEIRAAIAALLSETVKEGD